jgi:hypothetical protein
MSKIIGRVIVRVEHLLAVEPFQSNEETRYYLGGQYIESHPSGGAILVATDGHTLACLHDPDAIVEGDSTIWSAPWKTTFTGPMREFAKLRPSSLPPVKTKNAKRKIYAELTRTLGQPSQLRLVAAENAAEVFNEGGIEFFSKRSVGGQFWIDGTFPEYRRVIPIPEGEFMPQWFQGRYVAKMAAFGQAVWSAFHEDKSETSSGMTILSGAHADGPAVARFSIPNVFVVIMPVRHKIELEPSKAGLPDWYFDQDKKPEAGDKPDLQVAA